MILQIDTRDSATVDEALLILNALKGTNIASPLKEEPTAKEEPKKAVKTEPKTTTKTEPKTTAKTEPKTLEEKDWYSECRKVLIAISKGADEMKMNSIKDLLSSFGGAKLSDIPQESLKDLHEALEGLNE